MTVLEVGDLMDPIERPLKEIFFPALVWEYKVNDHMQSLQGHSIKLGGLGIPHPK